MLLLLFVFLARKPCDAYWTTFLSVENALREALQTMPDVRDQREIAPGERDKLLHPTLLLARGCNQVAQIILNLTNADEGSYAKERALDVTRQMAEDVRHFSGMSTFRSFHACLGVCA